MALIPTEVIEYLLAIERNGSDTSLFDGDLRAREAHARNIGTSVTGVFYTFSGFWDIEAV